MSQPMASQPLSQPELSQVRHIQSLWGELVWYPNFKCLLERNVFAL